MLRNERKYNLSNALELFQPFIIQKMFKLKIVNTIKEAKNKIHNKLNIIDKILEMVVQNL